METSVPTNQKGDFEGTIILRVTDSPKPGASQEFSNSVADVMREGHKQLIVDFSEMYYVNTMWIGALAAATGNLRKAGGNLILVNVCSAIQRVFCATRLDRTLLVATNMPEALELLKKSTKAPHRGPESR